MFPGPPTVQLSADLDDIISPVRCLNSTGISSDPSRRALPVLDLERALETRDSAASISRHDTQNFDPRLHPVGHQMSANIQQTRLFHSQRSAGDHPAGAVPELEPLTGEDTLPSSFHVESVYSHALMRDDTISTWAPGSQQDTARSRRPDPTSTMTTAPSSLASDRLPPQAAYQDVSPESQLQAAAPRPSVSYMRSAPPKHEAPQATWHASPSAIAETKEFSSASTVSSSSHFQLAAKYGSKQKPAAPQHQPGSSHSYELPSSSAVKQEASLAMHSAMSGVILSQQRHSSTSTNSLTWHHCHATINAPVALPVRCQAWMFTSHGEHAYTGLPSTAGMFAPLSMCASTSSMCVLTCVHTPCIITSTVASSA